MKIILGCIKESHYSVEKIENFAKKRDFEIASVFVDSETNLIKLLNECVESYHSTMADFIIIIDRQGIFPFMYLSKFKSLIVAEITDDYSAHMVRRHNNANVLVIASEVVGEGLLYSIIDKFLKTKFEAGRHIPRVELMTAEDE